MIPYVLIWGGGDLATGVAIRLHRVGIRILVVETHRPLAVRRTVSFAQAVYDGEVEIEDITGCLIDSPDRLDEVWENRKVPVIVDPDLALLEQFPPLALIDARMRKKNVKLSMDLAPLVVGLGPGFTAGENCHAAVETNRGHFLGRVCWECSPEADTGIPGSVQNYASERVLHAPVSGQVTAAVKIGDWVEKDELIMQIDGTEIRASFSGLVRGLIYPGLHVEKGVKVGDIDPRNEPFRCWYVSDKSLAIGGGALEALLTHEMIREQLWV